MNYSDIDIREKIGQKNPFKVPEGYFDQLTAQVMSNLPEKEEQAQVVSLSDKQEKSKGRTIRLRPIFYAAASVLLVLVMSLTVYFRHSTKEQPLATNTTSTTSYDNSYIDEVADYAMLDNVEIYACLSENY